jgi:hypothetical protein
MHFLTICEGTRELTFKELQKAFEGTRSDIENIIFEVFKEGLLELRIDEERELVQVKAIKKRYFGESQLAALLAKVNKLVETL